MNAESPNSPIEEYLLDIIADAKENDLRVIEGIVGYQRDFGWIAAIRKIYHDPEIEGRATLLELSYSYSLPDSPANGSSFDRTELVGKPLAVVGDISVKGQCSHGLQCNGEAMFIDDFYDEYKVRKSIRKKVDEAFEQLADLSFPDDAQMDAATGLYNNDPMIFHEETRRTVH